MKDNQALILEACKRDLGKSNFETYLTEVGWCMNDIVFMSNNLAKFAQDESPPDIALTNRLFGPKIRKDPLGTVLIIGYIFLPCGLKFRRKYREIMLTQLDCL